MYVRGRGAAAGTLDGSARQLDTEFGTMFPRESAVHAYEPQLPKTTGKPIVAVRPYNR